MAREDSQGKRPFKIWDGYRNIRKSLVASSLKDLEIRGKEKLNISQNECVRLVLETDGTQIEDPEYFKTLPNNTTVLLLRDDEYWYPAEVDAIKTAIAAIPKIVCETIHALELQDETPSWKIMDNKGRVTVVLHWDHRNQTYRGSGNSSGMDTSPAKRTMSHQQNGMGAGSLLMENNGPLKREPNQSFRSQQPTVYRHGSTPQITVIHHDAITPPLTDSSSLYQQLQQGRRLSKQGSSSMDAAAIHVHTSECSHFIPPPPSHQSAANGTGSPRAGSPGRSPLIADTMLPPPLHMTSSADHHGFECDFHCCALHEEGRRIAVHKSVATSPIQECHHAVAPQPPPSVSGQPASSSLSDGTRRASPKGHVRFLDTTGSPPLPPPPMLPPSPPVSPSRRQQPHKPAEALQPPPPASHLLPPPPQMQHRSDSSDSETETTVIEEDSMTSEKFLLLIDQLVDKQGRHLTVKDIGIILERLNATIVDVERLDRDYEAIDCYNWTIKATIRGNVLQDYGIIYNGSYYGISEHPGYRQNDDELTIEDELDDDRDVNDASRVDDCADEDRGHHGAAAPAGRDERQHRRRADEETNDSEVTHDTAELLETNTTCSQHITPENEIQQKLDNLIKTTRNILNILEFESDTDENTEEVVSDHPATTQRNIAAQNLKSQADKMVTRDKGILPPLKVGDNVLLSIPSVDRGRGDAANLLSVIIEEKDGKFRIATKEGILNTWLEQNSLAATKYCSLTTTDVQNLKNEYSLRELVRLESVGTGQGYRRCNCRANCTSKKCTCRKNNMICNSACHPGCSCQNV